MPYSQLNRDRISPHRKFCSEMQFRKMKLYGKTQYAVVEVLGDVAGARPGHPSEPLGIVHG